MPPSKPPHKSPRAQMNPYARPPPTSTISTRTGTGTSTGADPELTSAGSQGKKEKDIVPSSIAEAKALSKKKHKKKKRDKSRPDSIISNSPATATAAARSQSPDKSAAAAASKVSLPIEESETYKRYMKIHASPAKPLATLSDPNAIADSLAKVSKNKEKEKHQHQQMKLQRQLEIRQEDAKRKEEHERLKREYEKTKADAESMEAALKKRIEELEVQVKAQQEQVNAQCKAIETHDVLRDSLKEAVGCGVCMETLDDPHILSCGHVACKRCLKTWFRTAGAYVHEILPEITDETDLSHRSKVCHVCRAIVLRRPARVFFIRDILEPLGLSLNFPTASQEQVDPWDKTFPVEPESYRLYDEEDNVWRCPTCVGEIEDGFCEGCNNQFSDIEVDEEEDWESEQDEVGSILEGMGFGHSDDGNASGSDTTSTDESIDALPHGRRINPLAPALMNVLNILDTEAEEDHAGHSHSGSASGSESDIPSAGSEDEYGGSFIDDSSVQAISGGDDDDMSEDEDDDGVAGSEVDELDGSSAENVEEEEEDRGGRPNAAELRRRRVGALASAPARTRTDPIDDEESPVVPTRRARAITRRAITVISDDSD